MKPGRMTGQDIHRNPDFEPTAVLGPEIVGHLPVCHLAIPNCGDAGAKEEFLRFIKVPVEYFGVVGEMEVGTVIRDLDSVGAGEEVAGRVKYAPQRRPVLLAVNEAAGWCRCVLGDASGLIDR